MNPPELISTKEAAGLMGIHPETFRRHRAMGLLSSIQVFPGNEIAQKKRVRQRVVKQSVLDYLHENTERME